VATQVADDHWTVEIRIPVTEDDSDPLHFVVGRKPSKDLPWFFNVCRQRIRQNGSEYSAVSPTGELNFHRPRKFGYFYHGRHHVFDVDETVTDFHIEYRAAAQLKSGGKFAAAQAAFAALADHEQASDFQKSRTLAQAAGCARHLKDYAAATAFASRIPQQPLAAVSQMQTLVVQRKWQTIITKYGDADLTNWPFTEIGAAAFARGQARAALKAGDKAEADFQLAKAHTTDALKRLALLNARARNFELVLTDEDRALQLYQEGAASTRHPNHSEFFHAVLGAARILTSREKFDEALALQDRLPRETLRTSSWYPTIMAARGATLTAAGRTEEARAAWQAVLESELAAKAHRRNAEAAIQQLGQ
jgi:tetratricopeptide (TPR) repeat protein